MSKKRIVVSGLAYSITAAFEYFVRAAKRRDDLEVITVGPYFSNTMPYGTEVGGMKVPEKYIFRPDIILPQGHEFPVSFIENKVGDVNLWLTVDAFFHFTGKPKHGKNVAWLTDPHCIRNWYDTVEIQYDKIFCSQQEYIKPGEIYLPYAFDIEWNKPLENVEKIYDVSLVGNSYQHRVDLFNRLNVMGLNTFFKVGVAKDDMQLVYAQSKVGFNWATLKDLNARVFELMGCGLCSVMNRVPDLALHFEEGKHYLGFDTADEAVEKIKWALNNPTEAEQIGKNARQAVIDGKHSWDDRLNTILKMSL